MAKRYEDMGGRAAYRGKPDPVIYELAIKQLGIADRIAKPEALLDEARTWARELSQGSPTALALGKTILNQTFELTAEAVFSRGSQAQGICYTSTEHRESVTAFLAKTAQS